MVVISRPIHFDEDDPAPMFRHLDNWARRRLTTPDAWGSTIEVCGQWSDYSARNQVLLASYGVVGPVAGTATWGRVPSSDQGRTCAVRVGEHGLPVRVPIVGGGEVTSERSRSGGRSSNVAGSHRWEPVFALEQLARHPAPGALDAAVVPKLDDRAWAEVVRQATGRMVGRTPRKVADPSAQLSALVERVPLGPGRPILPADMVAQAAWVVADRVGRAEGPMPAFDPADTSARERWRSAVDVRHAAGRVLDALSFATGVELCRSSLPRHELADDRSVAPGRRNYLAPADVRALPLGVWIEAGPYTRAEWLARGVAGAVGVGAFLRVNDRSYLAAYETRTGALWRLETVGRGAHLGLVGEGTADDLAAAKAAVRSALAERFPEAARSIEASRATRVASPAIGWMPMPGGRDDRTEHRVFDDRVAAMVAPGPGGRWETWVSVDGSPRQGPLAPDAGAARQIADGLAHGALMQHAAIAPDRANAMVAERAAQPATWDRDTLVTLVGHRLTDNDRRELTTTNDTDRLIELLRDVGVLTPATMLTVLRAEGVDLDDVMHSEMAASMPVPAFVRQVHELWGADRVEIGTAIGATVEELRAAGCTPIELLAASPREELRRLDTRESTWERAAGCLLDAGYSVAETVEHLAAHAPTPSAFAVGVVTIVEQPTEAFALASRRAQPEDLVALGERYGLSTDDIVQVAAATLPLARALDVIDQCGNGDVDHATELAGRHLGLGPDGIEAVRSGTNPLAAVPAQVGVVDINDLESLRAAIGQPDATGVTPEEREPDHVAELRPDLEVVR